MKATAGLWLFLGLLLPRLGIAAEITYSITSYGGRHAVVILTGDVDSSVNTNMSADGLSIRISATGVEFVTGPSQSTGGLVTTVQQVRRGSASDLVINLSSASELSITPGSNDIKLFIKAKRSSIPKLEGTPSTIEHTRTLSKNLPWRFIVSPSNPNELQTAKMEGITLAFPAEFGMHSLTQASAELRAWAYALDMLWAFVSDSSIQYEQNKSCGTPVESADASQLENLVRDLTQELIELRKEKSARK